MSATNTSDKRRPACRGWLRVEVTSFHHALKRFEFLGWFRDIVVSGRLELIKPDPRIFQHLLDLHGLSASHSVFIDDAPKNVAAAAAIGMQAIHFTDPEALRLRLRELQLLERRDGSTSYSASVSGPPGANVISTMNCRAAL